MVEFLTLDGTPVSGVIIAFARGLTNSLPTYDITTVYMNTAQPLECLFSLLLFSGAIGILMPISPSSPAHLLSGALTLILTGWTQALSTAVRPSVRPFPACLPAFGPLQTLTPSSSLSACLFIFLPSYYHQSSSSTNADIAAAKLWSPLLSSPRSGSCSKAESVPPRPSASAAPSPHGGSELRTGDVPTCPMTNPMLEFTVQMPL